MQEADLYNYWHYYACSAETVYWNNNRLKIIDAGQLNEHQGPDFRFARFELNGVICQGAVEFHLDKEDWYRHNHQYDPAYQDVLLHIVGREPSNGRDVRHALSRRSIPTFRLNKPAALNNRGHCTSANLGPAETRRRLQQLAMERLQYKVSAFRKALKSQSEHALFYRNFFRILGYPNNKHTFQMLALKIPAHIYETYNDRPNLLTAIYFGCSGFLQDAFKDQYAQKLQKLYHHYAALLSLASLDKKQWQVSANRPLNHPHLRIAAWIAFLSSLNQQAPFNKVSNVLEQRLNHHQLYDHLHKIFTFKAQGYWQRHYALERLLKNKTIHRFLGPGRIDEVITNLIIPLSIAKAHKNNNLGFISFLQEFYIWMPGSCSYVSLIRKSPWLKEYQNIWQSCNSGQALLHLDEVYCSGNQCTKCPLERKKQLF